MPVGNVSNQAFAATVAAPFEACETSQVGGNFQNGCYGEPAIIGRTPFINLRVQPLPSAARVQLGAAGYDGYDVNVEQIGPNEYSVTLHVGNTLVLAPMPADCQNVITSPISPNTSQFQFRSRQRMVVSTGQDPNAYTPTCTLTAVAPGITEVTVTSFRNVNAAFGGAEPSGTEGTQCFLVVRVVA
jgi:hypothetical protein